MSPFDTPQLRALRDRLSPPPTPTEDTMSSKRPAPPNTNEIASYAHCGRCLAEYQAGQHLFARGQCSAEDLKLNRAFPEYFG
jgi:hypothetical protein